MEMFGTITFFIGVLTICLNLIRPVSLGLSIPDGFFIVSFVFFVLNDISKKRNIIDIFPRNLMYLPGYLILVGGLISTMNAHSTWLSILTIVKLFFTLVIVTGLTLRVAKHGKLKLVMICLIISGSISASVAVYDYLNNSNLGLTLVGLPYNYTNRYVGLFGHPNNQAIFLVISYCLTIPFVFSKDSSHKTRFIAIIPFIVLQWGIYLTGSVTGYISYIVCTTIYLCVVLRKVGIICIVILLITFFSLYIYRFNFLSYLSFLPEPVQVSVYRVLDITAFSRYEGYKESFNYLLENPFLGAGMDQISTSGLELSEFISGSYIHNAILQIWIAGGFLSFLSLLFCYLYGLKLIFKTFVTGNRFSIAIALSVLSWIIADQFQTAFYQREKWLVFALLLGVFILKNNKQGLNQQSSSLLKQNLPIIKSA